MSLFERLENDSGLLLELGIVSVVSPVCWATSVLTHHILVWHTSSYSISILNAGRSNLCFLIYLVFWCTFLIYRTFTLSGLLVLVCFDSSSQWILSIMLIALELPLAMQASVRMQMIQSFSPACIHRRLSLTFLPFQTADVLSFLKEGKSLICCFRLNFVSPFDAQLCL